MLIRTRDSSGERGSTEPHELCDFRLSRMILQTGLDLLRVSSLDRVLEERYYL